MTAATRPPARGGMPLSTVALTLVTIVAAASLGRLFKDGSVIPPVIAAAIGAHLVAWGCRRLSMPPALTYLVSSTGVVLALAWLALPQTTAYGFPGFDFIATARDELRQSIEDFRVVVAPASVTSGFIAASVLGTAVAAFLADWAAFRMRATFEAIIPSFTLFLFAAVLGTPQHRSLSIAAYLAALSFYLVTHHAELQAGGTAWFASRSRNTATTLVQLGAFLALSAIVAALVIGPRLPGVGAEPVIAYRNEGNDGPSNRVTISPLVDIRGRLVDNGELTVFTVKSNERAYWRLTSLDTFDGRIWSSNGSYRPVKRRLPGGVSTEAPTDKVRQEFRILALSTIWLPAAYEPERIEGIDGASYEADSGSLISKSDTSDGLTYTVESELPRPTRDQLETAANRRLRIDLQDRYLALPPIDRDVLALAQSIVAGKATPYERARALQDHFRSGQFTYNLAARPGHDGRALRNFLFRTREGYCEQFSGAYAVMARAVGLPARVAVGFTPGELDATSGEYVVRSLNAHAWPEVYLEGFGWVAFEPTPGRGVPGGEEYTGVPEAQASAANPNTSVTPSTTPTTVAGSTDTTAPPRRDADDPLASGEPAPSPSVADRIPAPIKALALLAVLAAVVLLVGVPAVRAVRDRRRRARAVTSRDRVLLAWEEACEALARAGRARRPSRTVAEHIAFAAPALAPAAAAALHQLGQDVTAASYAPGDVDDDVAERAQAAAATVARAVHDEAGWRQRLRWWADPRPLLAAAGTRQVVRSGRTDRAA